MNGAELNKILSEREEEAIANHQDIIQGFKDTVDNIFRIGFGMGVKAMIEIAEDEGDSDK